MSVKVEIYPPSEMDNNSFTEWTSFHLHTNLKQLIFVFYHLHKFHNFNLCKLYHQFLFFRHKMLWFEALTYMINQRVLVHVCMHCLKTFDSFAFKMYFQTEAVVVKMIQVNRPINCLEFM